LFFVVGELLRGTFCTGRCDKDDTARHPHLATAVRGTHALAQGFTVTALAMLPLGMGRCRPLFSVVDRVLLEPLPYPEPDRLVQLMTTSGVGEKGLVSIPKYLFWRDTTTSFESMAAYDIGGPEVNLTQGANHKGLRTARVSTDYLNLFGAQLHVF